MRENPEQLQLVRHYANTGKTFQKLLEEYKYPYLLIVCEMIKTAIENKQNLIVEGGYIPLGYRIN